MKYNLHKTNPLITSYPCPLPQLLAEKRHCFLCGSGGLLLRHFPVQLRHVHRGADPAVSDKEAEPSQFGSPQHAAGCAQCGGDNPPPGPHLGLRLFCLGAR